MESLSRNSRLLAHLVTEILHGVEFYCGPFNFGRLHDGVPEGIQVTRALLLHEEESSLDVAATVLRDMGWPVHVATSRVNALSICTARRPDLAIVDIEMRGGVGLEAISAIRRSDKEIFVLAITRGSCDELLLKVAESCGSDHHVIGPVTPAKLLAAIEFGRDRGFLSPGP